LAAQVALPDSQQFPFCFQKPRMRAGRLYVGTSRLAQTALTVARFASYAGGIFPRIAVSTHQASMEIG
jgi:hypothetical protein